MGPSWVRHFPFVSLVTFLPVAGMTYTYTHTHSDIERAEPVLIAWMAKSIGLSLTSYVAEKLKQ
jgi:hypothetical protein